jgi:predicted O-linked N-acetylglucosamine transferase (SPINDLY family)
MSNLENENSDLITRTKISDDRNKFLEQQCLAQEKEANKIKALEQDINGKNDEIESLMENMANLKISLTQIQSNQEDDSVARIMLGEEIERLNIMNSKLREDLRDKGQEEALTELGSDYDRISQKYAMVSGKNHELQLVNHEMEQELNNYRANHKELVNRLEYFDSNNIQAKLDYLKQREQDLSDDLMKKYDECEQLTCQFTSVSDQLTTA